MRCFMEGSCRKDKWWEGRWLYGCERKTRKINSSELYFFVFRLSGYIEYLKIASCSAFKSPSVRCCSSRCRYMPGYDILTSPFFFLSFCCCWIRAAHKMHILEIKRKFVSYLLCSMGISYSPARPSPFRRSSSPANIIKKENLFFQKKRRQLSRIERAEKTIYRRKINFLAILVYVEHESRFGRLVRDVAQARDLLKLCQGSNCWIPFKVHCRQVKDTKQARARLIWRF